MSIIKVDYGSLDGGGIYVDKTYTGSTGTNNITIDNLKNISVATIQYGATGNICTGFIDNNGTLQHREGNSSYYISQISGNVITYISGGANTFYIQAYGN